MKRRRPYLTLSQRLEIPAFLLLVGITLLFVLIRPMTHLERVKHKGELVVATRIGSTTFQPMGDEAAGFEHDLVKAFANHLGVKVRWVVPDRFDGILPRVEAGRVDLAAAGITVTRQRLGQVRFGPHYQQVTEELVYRNGGPRPEGLEDLRGARIAVVAGSSHAETLRHLARDHPWLDWEAIPDVTPDELMRRVAEEQLDFTVADSNELVSVRRFFPELRAAMELSEPRFIAWAFPKTRDTTLVTEAETFFQTLADNGRLQQIRERHFGIMDVLDYPGLLTFMRLVRERLPEFEPLFREAEQQFEMDWRLLAAISYQESHWDPDAISRTGVRGMMMLTQATAGQVGISDRTDPRASVMGGTEYFLSLRRRLPDTIREPDRTWMALAAYNVGLGHLEDARRITEAQGKDPDRWIDVMEHLPLLSQRQWHQDTRHGYARGWEPVQYVQNIRGYYDILSWFARTGEEDTPSKGRDPVENAGIMEILPPGL
ncbi:MAG: membrane-bound lytic murein transglycosylase MltF [Ectothiorhodospira sp.]